jgi:predicted SAM-dependent methyltransferase
MNNSETEVPKGKSGTLANPVFGHFIERSTSRSFLAALRAVAREWRIMRAHRGGVRKASSVKLPCALHIGCGPNRKPGWVNIDLDKEADIRLDLREALPFPDNSVKMVYSEHFFEHLSLEEGSRFLRECLRVLLPTGRLSVGVPNAQLCMQDYVRGDRDEWLKVRDRYHPKWCSTPMHSVNYFFRQDGEHKYVYDTETLIVLVRDCGFSDVHERPWDPALDLEVRRDGTLYVDGEKPA